PLSNDPPRIRRCRGDRGEQFARKCALGAKKLARREGPGAFAGRCRPLQAVAVFSILSESFVGHFSRFSRRVGAGVAPRPSHRSVLAQLRHTARQVTDSPHRHKAGTAIRWSLVHTILELGVSFMFPSNDSMTRRPLPSTGSPWGEFPRFAGTT